MKVIPFTSPSDQLSAVAYAAEWLAAGKLLVYPTETVYGVGGRTDHDTVERLALLKGRDPDRPFLVIAHSADVLDEFQLEWTDAARALAAAHWPGPLTLVLRSRRRDLAAMLANRNGGMAVRCTPHPGLQMLLREFGAAITSTSANATGAQTAATISDFALNFREMAQSSDLLALDAGALALSLPSTLVDCTHDEPVVARAGALSYAQLRNTAPQFAWGVRQ